MHHADPLVIKTLSGKEITLTPVPMKATPSNSNADWLKFQGKHVEGSELSKGTTSAVQMYMRVNRTEALTDGERNLTIAGDMLAVCFPEKFKFA